MTKLNVKIKRLHQDAAIPTYAHEFDSGFDLVAIEDVIVEPGKTVKVPTGLAFELPEGYELQVRPRSGITLRTKLRVQLGTVDSIFRGEVCVIVDNTSEKELEIISSDGENWFLDPAPTKNVIGVDGIRYTNGKSYPVGTYLIRKGDKIAQGVIAPVAHVTFSEVDKLEESDRGANGFGSSGVKSE